MITFITTRKLAGLRAESADLQGRLAVAGDEAARFRETAAELRRQVAAAQSEATRARAAYGAAVDNAAATLRSLKAATEHPVHGRNIKADIALNVVRLEVERVKAEGDPEAIESVKILDWLIGAEPEPETADARP